MVVQMLGCTEPMELYGFDIDWTNIPASFGEEPFNVGPAGDTDKIVIDFATDPNVTALQKRFHDDFFETFDKGVQVTVLCVSPTPSLSVCRHHPVVVYGAQAYLGGRWATARRLFRAVLDMHPDDGPTQCLMDFIQDYDAPADWPGYRPILEK